MTALDTFAARKTAEAEAAPIERLVTEIDRGDALMPIGNEWTRQIFDGNFYLSSPSSAELPATSLVFVRSREGNTVAKDPSTLGGGEADKHVIYEGLSRVAADAVLGGAGTVHGDLVLSIWRPEIVALRASFGLPRHPIQIVATIRGLDLTRRLMFNSPELRVIIVTTLHGADAMRPALEARPWISVVAMEQPGDLAWAFKRLREHGIERLSCIGGRTLAEELIDAGLVRDLYLTTSPKSAGKPGSPFYAKPLATREVVRKLGTGADRGVVFQHLLL